MTHDRSDGDLDCPGPFSLAGGYARHAPTLDALSAQLTALAGLRPWADLSWTELIESLLAAGRTDIPLARLLEGHVDAVRILDQAGARPHEGALYGVWASRSEQTGVHAERIGTDLVLSGTVRFASGSGVLDRALVPVWLSAQDHLLVDLPVRELAVDGSSWHTEAMKVSRSFTVGVSGLRVSTSRQVGEPNFYLSRPGFFPGGAGVAACWVGGAARILDLTVGRLRAPVPTDYVRRVGEMDTALHAGLGAVRQAAAELDQVWPGSAPGSTDRRGWQRSATIARAVAADSVHTLLQQASRVAGPAGLAYDEDLTRAVHDLELYVLQRNADGDAQFIGDAVLRAIGLREH